MRENKSAIQNTIRCFIALNCLWEIAVSFHCATYATFFKMRGLNLFQANIPNIFFFGMVALLEIPTGVIADVFGRKASFIAACILYTFGQFIYFFAHSLAGFIIAEIVFAVGATCQSGAFDAWAIDRLSFYGFRGDTAVLFSRASQWTRILAIGGAFFGTYVARYDIAFPWLVGGSVDCALTIAAIVLMREEYFVYQAKTARAALREMHAVGREGLRFMRAHSAMRFVVWFVLSLSFGVMASNMQWQIYFGRFYSNIVGNGYLWLCIAGALFLGARYTPRMIHMCKGKQTVLIVILILVGSSMTFVTLSGIFSVSLLLYLAHCFFRGMVDPVQNAYLNDHITTQKYSEHRATIISINSMFAHIGGALGLFASGFLAKKFSLQTAWIFSGIALITSGIVIAKKFKLTTSDLGKKQ